jgi:hypothetical protein
LIDGYSRESLRGQRLRARRVDGKPVYTPVD